MRDRVSIKGGCASAKLIKNRQGPLSGEFEHIPGLLHLNIESTLAFKDSIRGTDPCEDPIDWSQLHFHRWNVAPNLCHDYSYSSLPQQSGLSTHIGPCH